MWSVWDVQWGLSAFLLIALIVLKAAAFISALLWTERYYDAAGKLTKAAWCLITGLSLAAQVLLPSWAGLLNLVGTVASIVYLVDVRPAMQSLRPR